VLAAQFESFQRVVFNVALLAPLLGPRRETLARAVHDHCDGLGNSDGDAVLGVALWQQSFAPLVEGLRHPSGGHFALLVLAYLIDHCRIMYRPLLLSVPLVHALCTHFKMDTLQDVFANAGRDVLPKPAPFFGRVDGRRGDHSFWLWVPVKKPHSSTYDGTTYLPLPAREPEPPFFQAAAGQRDADENPRPLKRPRTESCAACGKHTAASHSLVFWACSPGCVDHYYQDL
jgi:hypothetical protein